MRCYFLNLAFLSGVLLGQHGRASASSAGAAALKAIREIDYRYFVAGGTCAAFSHGFTTPIDVVKTRIQAKPKVSEMGIVPPALRIKRARLCHQH